MAYVVVNALPVCDRAMTRKIQPIEFSGRRDGDQPADDRVGGPDRDPADGVDVAGRLPAGLADGEDQGDRRDVRSEGDRRQDRGQPWRREASSASSRSLPQPDAGHRRADGGRGRVDDLVADRGQVDVVAESVGEGLDGPVGVVAGAVEATVDGPLDSYAGRAGRARRRPAWRRRPRSSGPDRPGRGPGRRSSAAIPGPGRTPVKTTARTPVMVA